MCISEGVSNLRGHQFTTKIETGLITLHFIATDRMYNVVTNKLTSHVMQTLMTFHNQI